MHTKNGALCLLAEQGLLSSRALIGIEAVLLCHVALLGREVLRVRARAHVDLFIDLFFRESSRSLLLVFVDAKVRLVQATSALDSEVLGWSIVFAVVTAVLFTKRVYFSVDFAEVRLSEVRGLNLSAFDLSTERIVVDFDLLEFLFDVRGLDLVTPRQGEQGEQRDEDE